MMRTIAVCLLLWVVGGIAVAADTALEGRLVEIVAGGDNTFRVPNTKSAVIRAHAGEMLHLRITSKKGSELARDGAVHSLVIRSLRDQGWDIRLYEGTHDYQVKAPTIPGEYVIECTVKCGRGHDDMHMKLVVEK
jgi:heme/copper-type cytochrome/quinol oxidase subunit 2